MNCAFATITLNARPSKVFMSASTVTDAAPGPHVGSPRSRGNAGRSRGVRDSRAVVLATAAPRPTSTRLCRVARPPLPPRRRTRSSSRRTGRCSRPRGGGTPPSVSSGSPKLRTRSQPDVAATTPSTGCSTSGSPSSEHAVHDLLHGPVAPDGHEEPAPVLQRLSAPDAWRRPGASRDLEREVETVRGEGAFERRELAGHAAAPRVRVRDHGEGAEGAGHAVRIGIDR